MRKASAIELLDARTMMKVKGYRGEAHGCYQSAFTIDGRGIAELGHAFDLAVDVKAHELELRIDPGELGDWDCEALEVLGETHGVLYYRVGHQGYQGDGEIVYSEFSYNGKYIVHWA